ncbi:hypothetical protein ACFL27_03615 [candidate division CSSED10-310 bacterium]|uniref:Phorbol-ester/DAG-type domain-containing protein n=1 Tax=candidate division CSSED10-310 bacterium TaxID=2855610 RepID=A0ABV6YSW3_UNCC1
MNKIERQCSACSVTFYIPENRVGKRSRCPKCGQEQILAAGGNQLAKTLSENQEITFQENEERKSIFSQEATITPSQIKHDHGIEVSFPERMKANKALACRICSYCTKEIELGDEVYNCQTCGKTLHEACFSLVGQCGSEGCGIAAQTFGPSFSDESQRPHDTKPCRYCGEDIKKSARKCRFCGEYQTDYDRQQFSPDQKDNYSDEKLTIAEILFGLLCSWIALIFAIVWLIQGRKKGWKLLAISLISTIIFIMMEIFAEV